MNLVYYQDIDKLTKDDFCLLFIATGGVERLVIQRFESLPRPAILLADEPTGNLDPTNSWEIMSLLKEANERGTTVLVVTHNQEIVNEMNERVITMKQGVIVSDERKGGYTDED